MVDARLEKAMELTICRDLDARGWDWVEDANDEGFDPELALFPEDVLFWLQTQYPEQYERAIPKDLDGTRRKAAEHKLLTRLAKQLDTQPQLDGVTRKVKGGLLGTLRDGFTFAQMDRPQVTFPDMAGFFPYDPAKTNVIEKAKKNRLRVIQQVHFEKGLGDTIDLVLLVNGIPVVTIELKTDNTQDINDAVVQYKNDRRPGPKRPLLAPGRCLVHFAVSSTEVQMTTRLDGPKTVFLPFNMGTDDGRAGNPNNPDGYKTAYLWEWVFSPELFLRILKDYALWEPSSKGNDGRLIFPRFHQLRSVERFTDDVIANGTGSRYLIQHSAGSGKTKTIAWMAHRANKMIHEDGSKLFDCVIVVTDRTVLDRNVADGLSLLQASEGMVINITSDETSKSEKLNHYLTQGKRILSCTIQTFPALAQTIDRSPKLRNRRWLVIIDEAHSSQHGKASRTLLETLSDTPDEIADAAALAAADVDGEDIDADGEVTQNDSLTPPAPTPLTREEKDALQQQRDSAVARSSNVTIVALTATPKAKTLAVFGSPDPDNPDTRIPFDLYSMAQAIDEGFILDVLDNYISMDLYAKIEDKLGRTDEVDLGEATSALKAFIRSHDKTIQTKAHVAVEHFHKNVRQLLGGTAKAMVVCHDRMSAYTWFRAVQDVIKSDERYHGMEALVAFSGALDVSKDPDVEKLVTESLLNNEGSPEGKRRMDTAKMFDGVQYKFLIVANKYQTGFDEPRLSAMYVDKPLNGVMAVQTLSRLNRTLPKRNKQKTFVVDFVNAPETILKSFEPYYSQASIDTDIDPNVLSDLGRTLDASQFYDEEDMNAVAHALLDHGIDEKAQDKRIRLAIDPVVTRWDDFYKGAILAGDDENKAVATDFRANLEKYVHAWEFLSQFIDFQDVTLHKRAVFASVLVPNLKLGKGGSGEDYVTGIELVGVVVDGDVDKGQKLMVNPVEASRPLAVPGFDGRLSPGGAGDPLQGAFDLAVKEVNDLFSAAGIDMSNSANARMVHSVWELLADDKDVEQMAEKNDQDALAKSNKMKEHVLSAMLEVGDQNQQFIELITGGNDALTMFVGSMARLAAAAIQDKRSGHTPEAVVGEATPVEKLAGIVRENLPAGASVVEDVLAMQLDTALRERGEANVFSVVHSKFVDYHLPVDGILFERVTGYAMSAY